MTLLGQMQYNNSTLHGRLSDVWGHVDSLGNEYAIVGLQKGVSIVDVSDPNNLNEVFYVSGPSTIWRDIKTWDNHAYITNEKSGGMMIIDMSALPGAITANDVYYHTGTSYPFYRAHNLYIDENGLAYIFGSNYGKRGAIFLDLNNNPKVPQEVGVFDSLYLHDGMARGDTLWGAAVYAGDFVAVDVSNRANPVILRSHQTSGSFAHNCWISNDGNTLFTTDEISGGAITSYDVSDLGNIDELDLIWSNPGTGVIPHNTHVYGNFLVTSYYRDGVTVVDATNPDRLVQVGNYDTSPALDSNGFNGCWGAYPYLPSGNLLATDIENGLFVFGVDYIQGVYLKGNTRRFSDSTKLGSTVITHLNSGTTFTSNLNAFYKKSYADSGWHHFAFARPGFIKDTLSIYMQSGQMHQGDVYLRSNATFTLNGHVQNEYQLPFDSALVLVDGKYSDYRTHTNSIGDFVLQNVFEGEYEITSDHKAGLTACDVQIISPGDSLILQNKSIDYFEDDFTFDWKWDTINQGSSGFWERVELDYPPTKNTLNFPLEDVSHDCSNYAYVTGTEDSTDHDVDGGWNILERTFDPIPGNGPMILHFSYWFKNDANTGSEDSLIVEMQEGSTTSRLLSINNAVNLFQSVWIDTSIVLENGTGPFKIKFKVGDFGNDDLLECAIDNVVIDRPFTFISEVNFREDLQVYPNPFKDRIGYRLKEGFNGGNYVLRDLTGRIVCRGNLSGSAGEIQLQDVRLPGMYILTVSSEQETFVVRLIKN